MWFIIWITSKGRITRTGEIILLSDYIIHQKYENLNIVRKNLIIINLKKRTYLEYILFDKPELLFSLDRWDDWWWYTYGAEGEDDR